MSTKFVSNVTPPANANDRWSAPPGRRVEIVEPGSAQQFAHAADLMRGFIQWCRARYAERAWAVETYFQPASVEKELAALDLAYAAPGGALLLALVDGVPAGCVALRTLGDGVCEMKRLFIREPFQGLGIGRRLCEALIALAGQRGFRAMRLETGDKHLEAHALYRSLGFAEIAPYYDAPAELRPYLTFMERPL